MSDGCKSSQQKVPKAKDMAVQYTKKNRVYSQPPKSKASPAHKAKSKKQKPIPNSSKESTEG